MHLWRQIPLFLPSPLSEECLPPRHLLLGQHVSGSLAQETLSGSEAGGLHPHQLISSNALLEVLLLSY